MVRLAFAMACCVLAVGTAAQAQDINASGDAGTYINGGPNPATGVGSVVTDFGAANYASTIKIVPTNLNPVTVSFESGNTVTGQAMNALSYTNVNLVLTNDTNTMVSPTLHSQITAAGMGFYMADIRTCGDSPATCAQSQGLATLSDLRGAASTTLGGAAFDFTIIENEHELYSVHGSMSLDINSDGFVTLNTSVGDASEKLFQFRTVELGNEGSAFGFQWDVTNVPLLSLFDLDPGNTDFVTYQVRVSSFTNGGCLDDGFTCLIAYSAFGDPIGRGGDVTSADNALFSAGGLLGSFGGIFGSNDGPRFITGVTLSEVTVAAPTVTVGGGVPEPATWISMILGFGLLGAALRRRRGSAYA